MRIYGISQNPATNDYIMVLQGIYYSGNKKIDDLIQEMQLKINNQNDIVFEWIPYNQFDNIEEISKSDVATVCSAMWKDGPLCYNYGYEEYVRKSDRKVVLKCLHNLQNITNEFLNEVCESMKFIIFFNITNFLKI